MKEFIKPNIDYKEFDNEDLVLSNMKEIIKSIHECYGECGCICDIENIDNIPYSEIIKVIYEWINNYIIGICGCGSPDMTIEKIVDYLQIVDEWTRFCADKKSNVMDLRLASMMEKFGVKYITDDPLLQFMAYILDDRNLTDHGSGINGTWITDLGEICLYSYKVYFKFIEEGGKYNMIVITQVKERLKKFIDRKKNLRDWRKRFNKKLREGKLIPLGNKRYIDKEVYSKAINDATERMLKNNIHFRGESDHPVCN